MTIKKPIFSNTPIIVAFGGGAAGGKTTIAKIVAGYLGPRTPATWLNTDAIRKELAGVPWSTRLDSSHYTEEARDRVYNEVLNRAAGALGDGRSVIFDAGFGRVTDRRSVEVLAENCHRPFCGLFFEAPLEVRVLRAKSRTGTPSDADDFYILNREQIQRPDVLERGWHILDSSGTAPETLSLALSKLHKFVSAPEILQN
jgi:predicted kinase